ARNALLPLVRLDARPRDRRLRARVRPRARAPAPAAHAGAATGRARRPLLASAASRGARRRVRRPVLARPGRSGRWAPSAALTTIGPVLRRLRVENLVLIREAELELAPGLNA